MGSVYLGVSFEGLVLKRSAPPCRVIEIGDGCRERLRALTTT